MHDVVIFDLRGAVAVIVSPLIGSDGVAAGFDERFHLVPPGKGNFRKGVTQNNGQPFSRPVHGKSDTVGVYNFDWGKSISRYPPLSKCGYLNFSNRALF
jgi:hypothetical protein